jgi:phosphoglycolate phosphatase
MYTYFLFDLDGTLTDPKEGITRCIQYALTKFDIDEPDLDSLTKFIGPPLGPSFSKYYGLSAAQAEDAVRYFRERYKPIGIFENAVYDGVPAMLQDLKAHGRIIALATAKPQVFAEQILDYFGIREYFDCIVGTTLKRKLPNGKEVDVTIKPYSKDGDKVTLYGKSINGGNYVYIISVAMPNSVSDKEIELLKEIKKLH